MGFLIRFVLGTFFWIVVSMTLLGWLGGSAFLLSPLVIAGAYTHWLHITR